MENSRERSMETITGNSMENSMERSMEGRPEEMADWDIVTEFIGSELAEFYSECEVSTELQ